MWLKAVFPTALLAFEVVIVKLSLAASIHDCWDPEKLNRMKFPVSQRETLHFLFFIHNCMYMIYYHHRSYLVESGIIK